MKYLIFFAFFSILLVACQSNDASENSGSQNESGSASAQPAITTTVTTPEGREHPVDSRITDQPQVREAMKKLDPKANNKSMSNTEPILIRKVNLTNPLNQKMVQKGQRVHEEKCAGCHTLDQQKTQLKSLAGITNRRTPEWIMNMTTGVVTSLETNAAAAQRLEGCPTRQAATRLNIEQARDYLEMLRNNDAK